MREKYIILRSTQPSPEDVTRSDDGAPPDPHAVRKEVEELRPDEVREFARDTSVLALAPDIPVALIAPLGDAAAVTEGSVSWGVEAVGASVSRFSGEGVTVAVLDTGIDENHPAFAGLELVQRDFTGQGNGDSNGHGTHCAGTFFGRNVGNTRIGVAPNVSSCLIAKVLSATGKGSSDRVVDAMVWAARSGAQVIAMSLGVDFPGYVRRLHVEGGLPLELATSRALEGFRRSLLLFRQTTELAKSLVPGSVIVAASGNESRRKKSPDFVVSAALPAVTDGIVSVGALQRVGNQLTVADFSNTGVLVCAPGVDIVSAGPNASLVALSGTSMAAPHVAGVAALWAQQQREAGLQAPGQVEALVRGLASPARLASGFAPTDVGAGLVSAP